MPRLPPILCFAAPSGTGKTTLIAALLPRLTAAGWRVGVVKSDAHRLVLDTPGKDSFRFREAGAARVVVAGRDMLGVFGRLDGDTALAGLVDAWLSDVDLVIVEGFRRAGLPSLRVRRAEGPGDEGWEPPANLIGWVSDGPVETALPVLPLGDPDAVVAWIQANFLSQEAPRRPPTVVFPCGDAAVARAVDPIAARIAARLGGPTLAVLAPGVPPPARTPAVIDLRPGLGPLGALLTGLAAADTPEVLLLGPRHHRAPDAFLAGLIGAGTARADVVVPTRGGFHEPLCAVYGHRCLGAIQAALLSGEPKMDGWWGQVVVQPLEEARWRAWDPGGAAFDEGERPLWRR